MNKLSDSIKSVVIVALVLLLGIASAMKLLEIQIVEGDNAVVLKGSTPSSLVYTRSVAATRGEIVDFSGNVIIGNTSQIDMILRKAQFPEDNAEGNSVLLRTYNELKARGYTVELNIPVSETAPYTFTGEEEENNELRSDLSLNVYATAENCIDKLISDYEIADTYSDAEKRIIAGLRYELLMRDFSYSNDFLLAENVDRDTVIEMKEMSTVLGGVDAVEAASREILLGNVLPHEIGTVGPIYAEEYDELKNEGYAMNDVVGKSGIERAMESELRGENGSERITITDGLISNAVMETESQSGNTVKLTINSTYQLKLQNILDNFIRDFQTFNQKPELKDVECGAIVVLDAKTGAVKGMATAPTYSLIEYKNDYKSLLNAENDPLFNRATDGLYRPGSTFKTITATAGLNEGIVNETSTYNCTRDYMYIDTEYHCTGHHHDIAVTRAIEVSCNIYFYELAQKLTIDRITDYSELFGLGQHTGLETGDAAGYLANPETFAAHNQDWYIGYVLQAGIGNIDCGMTPLQMACVASTLANNGVRYKPYLVDSVLSYGTDTIISKTQPEIAAQIDVNYENVFDLIEQGMIAASHNMPAKYSLANLGFDVAIKTGTPQVGENGEQNSFFIGYAPADDPEIAFAGVIEGGEYSKYMIRDIIKAYEECYGLNEKPPVDYITLPDPSGTGTITVTNTGTSPSANVQIQTQTQAVQPNEDSTEPTSEGAQEEATEAEPTQAQSEPSAQESTEAEASTEPPTEEITAAPTAAAPPPEVPEPEVPQGTTVSE